MQRLLQLWPKRMGYILNWQQYYILVFRWYWFYRHERFKRDMKACTKFFQKAIEPRQYRQCQVLCKEALRDNYMKLGMGHLNIIRGNFKCILNLSRERGFLYCRQ